MKRGRRRLYVRVLVLLWPHQKEKITALARRLGIAENEIHRLALDAGLPIVENSGIDNPQNGSTIDTSGQDDNLEENDDV